MVSPAAFSVFLGDEGGRVSDENRVKVIEDLPYIGTVLNPMYFSDGRNVFIAYEVAPLENGGVAVVRFSDVIRFHDLPMNAEQMGRHRYYSNGLEFYSFNECAFAEELSAWCVLKSRFWVISFNDVTLEIVFGSFEMVYRSPDNVSLRHALLNAAF